ncbi:MAG: nucleotide exchange factor GrpE, partial [Jatrophihabitans endophyticus]
MTAPKDQNPEGAPEEGAPQGGNEEFVEAEGPDVETSLTDADEAFLNGTGDLPDGTPAAGGEHLADLKRITAEYANYRRRTERERDTIRERATGDAARAFL